ncbi:MAG: hypothetical protein M0031_12930 [Thermaerobacter sp.]|nr:hypothetical protein [Thermaerobacter sp.]
MSMDAKGKLLSVEGGWGVVLTPGGDFRRVRLPRGGADLGDEVPLGRAGWTAWSGRIVLAAAAVLVAAGLWWWSGQTTALAAYVTVDINPSVELGVSAADRVVSATALDQDAVGVLRGLPYRGRSLEQVVLAITQRSMEQGFLSAEKPNAVVITYSPARRRVPPGVEAAVYRARQQTVALLAARHIKSEVTTLKASARLRRLAHQKKLSLGKYLVYLEAHKQGVPVHLSQLQHESIVQAIRQAKGKARQVLRAAQREKSFRELERKLRQERLRAQQKERHQAKKQAKKHRKSDQRPGQPASPSEAGTPPSALGSAGAQLHLMWAQSPRPVQQHVVRGRLSPAPSRGRGSAPGRGAPVGGPPGRSMG